MESPSSDMKLLKAEGKVNLPSQHTLVTTCTHYFGGFPNRASINRKKGFFFFFFLSD